MPSCRANAQQPKLFVGMILILIFAEALALYGLIGELLRTALHAASMHHAGLDAWVKLLSCRKMLCM